MMAGSAGRAAGCAREQPDVTRSRVIITTVALLAAVAFCAPPAGALVRGHDDGALRLRATPGPGSVTLSWNAVAERFRVIDVTGPDAVLLADGLRATSLTVSGLAPGEARTFRVRALGGGAGDGSATISAAADAAPPPPVSVPAVPSATARRPAAGTPMARAPAPPRVRLRGGRVTLLLPHPGRGARIVVFRAPRTGTYRRLGSTRRRAFSDDAVVPGRIVRYRLVRVSARGIASAASPVVTVRVPRT